MILRKNISLNEEYLRKLEPLMQKHNGNLSAVIREVIDLADAAFQDPDSVKKLISGLKKEPNMTSSALTWALKNNMGRLPDDEMIQNLLGKNISTISSLEMRLNELGGEIYWNTSVKIISDDDRHPRTATFIINGKNLYNDKFLGSFISLYLAKKYNLGISSVRYINDTLEINMIRGENDWIRDSVRENFGYLDSAISEIYEKPDFWNIIIDLYIKMNYDMVILSRSLFDHMQGESTHTKITTCLEKVCGCPLNKIPHEDLIKKIEGLFKPMGLVERIDIRKNILTIQHGFTEPKAIGKLSDIFIGLLTSAGYTYRLDANENLIILRHQSEMDRILIKMLEDLSYKEIPFKDYNQYLLKMLDMLNNDTDDVDIEAFSSLFGKILIQNYERNNGIDIWNTTIFIKYLHEASNILNLDLNWEAISDNVVRGKTIECNQIKNNDRFKEVNRRLIEELLNEWVKHAFGAQSTGIYKTQIEYMDKNDHCEIYVAI